MNRWSGFSLRYETLDPSAQCISPPLAFTLIHFLNRDTNGFPLTGYQSFPAVSVVSSRHVSTDARAADAWIHSWPQDTSLCPGSLKCLLCVLRKLEDLFKNRNKQLGKQHVEVWINLFWLIMMKNKFSWNSCWLHVSAKLSTFGDTYGLLRRHLWLFYTLWQIWFVCVLSFYSLTLFSFSNRTSEA